MSHVIFPRPEVFDPSSDRNTLSVYFVLEDQAGSHPPVFPDFKVRNIKVLKSQEEKEDTRRKYRRAYAQRADVRDKINKRLSNPDIIAKRKEYASRPDVKLRKQQLAGRARAIKRLLKEKEPKLYNNLVSELDARYAI